MSDVIWRPIPEYRLLGVPRGYEASSRAEIRSTDRTLANGRSVVGRVLALQADRDGYPTVKLGRKRFRVNVLVELAFAGPPEVRHLNGDRGDCTPGNLEWGSRWRNRRDREEQESWSDGGCYSPFPRTIPPVTASTGGRDAG